jgi:vitamin B12 transporter
MGRQSTAAAAALAFSALSTHSLQAQEAIALPQIVVSPTTVPTPLDQIASSVTVITAADLEREQIRTVPDALRTVPGLNVVQTGGAGGQTAVFMRGTNSNHVKVLLDGIDISDPSTPNGAFDFAHLLTGDVERIEVLRGPQSGLYGSDAIGGVISIITRKGEGPPKATASVEGGSFGSFNQAARLSGAQNNISYSFNILHVRQTDQAVTPADILAPGETRNPNSYDNWTYSTKLGVGVTDNVTANFTARYTDARLRLTGDDFVNFFPLMPPEADRQTQVNHNFFGRGEIVWSLFDGRFTNFFGVNYTNLWAWTNNPNADSFNPFGSVPPPTKNVGEKLKVDWRGEVKVAPGQLLVLGLEDERQWLWTNSTATAKGVQTVTTAETGNKAGFIELQATLAPRLYLVSNIRLDDNDSFGPHTTWRVAPAYIVPGTDTKLKASYGTGFKAPTLSQLFVNSPSFGQVANPNLRPEVSAGYDFGFEQPLWNDRLRFGVTYYHNDISDLIVNQFDPVTFTATYLNIGRATTQGVEAFASATINNQLRLRADYTYTDARDADTGLRLLRRPADKVSVSAFWTPLDRLTVTTTFLYVSSWVDVSRGGSVFIPRLDAPSYTTVNLSADYRASKNVTLFGRIDNLFDRKYENPIGFLQPRFGVFAGLRVSN